MAGTQLYYNYRNQKLDINLEVNKYSVANNQFKIIAKNDFGFFSDNNELLFFNGNKTDASLQVKTIANSNLTLDIKSWDVNKIVWIQSSKNINSNKLIYQINNLKQNTFYAVLINNKLFGKIKTTAAGALIFNYKTTNNLDELAISNAL